jgi:hypothetical protein
MMTAIRRKACLKEVDTNCDGNSCWKVNNQFH